MKRLASLLALPFLLLVVQPSPALAGTEFVVIGSGEKFTVARTSEVKIVDNSFSTSEPIEGSAAGRKRYFHHSRVAVEFTSKIEVRYEGKAYTLTKSSRESVSSRKEGEEKGAGLADALTRGEMLALKLMEKNLAVTDDAAGVITDKPFHLVQSENFPFDTAPAKLSFRYALVIEADGEKVVSHKFIRQGAEDEAEE